MWTAGPRKYNSAGMSILKVARMGHPVLRTKTKPLDRATIRSAVTQKLIDDMIETMEEYHGVGLAAPQVHEGLRLFVASLDMERGEEPSEPVAIINPEITPLAHELEFVVPTPRKPHSIAMLEWADPPNTWSARV